MSLLSPPDRFVDRHIGPSEAEIREMLDALGFASLEALVDDAVPEVIRSRSGLDLPAALTERQALAHLRELADRNSVFRSYLGMGYHDCVTPPVILRNVLEDPGWYTQYTPYQPEISQGRLEALLNFQTMVSDLTGMDIANSSMLDEATAAAEAMTLCQRVLRKNRSNRFFVSALCHPQTIEVVRTRAEPLGIEVVVGDCREWDFSTPCFGALLQYPATDGRIVDYAAFCDAAHAAGALVVVASDLLALTLLKSPGSFGADVVVGNSQRLGVPLGYGGPHAAFMATRDDYRRKLPGRLVGVSVDSRGEPALRLALQTREQHIRREKATSNICTAQVLLAVTASFYGVYHGPEGLSAIAWRVAAHTEILARALRGLGYTVPGPAFDTLRVSGGPRSGDEIVAAALAVGINLRAHADGAVGVALDETVEIADLQDLYAAFGGEGEIDASELTFGYGELSRKTAFMTHPVFHQHRSESQLLRYMNRLKARDLSLTTSMISLGSCTMKLNATAEMIPVTWRSFGGLHPFAPTDQAEGYAELFSDLERWLAEITGFAATSLQPNAGSQGEYAGLLVIRAWQQARGQGHRNICLIPKSAHGTNPASAVLAGMKVVVVKCDDDGNIDVDDLRAKAEKYTDSLSALMVTYPSTHGVYEASIREVCQIVHDHGGQVYLDGANMNALVGVAKLGEFGADVCHLNLHKTFCASVGTKVTLADGTSQNIEKLRVGQQVKAWSDDESGVRPAALEGVYRTGRKPCVEVTLEDGRTIVCTPDHRVRTTDGWIQAGELDPTHHRVIAGPEAPIDDPSEDLYTELAFRTKYGDLALTMSPPREREKTLAFFRLLGLMLSDGSNSISSASKRRHMIVFLGSTHDAERVVDDIELLTDKRPKISRNHSVFAVAFPVELTRAMAAVGGLGAPGRRVHSAAILPDVINDPATPRAILREFFGGLFGGDGCAPLVVHLAANPNAMKEVRFSQTRTDKAALEALMAGIQRGLARLGVESRVGRAVAMGRSSLQTSDDTAQRWRAELTVGWGTAFAERVGFRYCAHKNARLTAATAWWRMKETVIAQRDAVAKTALDMTSAGRSKSWRAVVDEAYQQVAGLGAILNPYYASFMGHATLHKGHLNKSLTGQPRKDRQGLRRSSRRAVLPAQNKRGEPTGMPTLETFLERTGTRGWFNQHTPRGSGEYDVTYAAAQDATVEPTMHLGVVDVRPVGERDVYDLTVTELHSFLANGAVVHNCIPHGGGGPGMGPICVAEHLAPYLPGHSMVDGVGGADAITAVSAAPWGSPSILPISYTYIAMMGPDGLTKATQVAILNANYMAARLQPHFPVLYTGANGRVAHECIIDTRTIKAASGVDVDDIAKRLMDFGFHAPTMSFPVAGTLMIEPTESEDKAEIDRLCDALIAIRQEARDIEEGRSDRDDNALKGAPHTADVVISDSWDRAYSREQAAFPAPWVRAFKFWPAVGRIDNAYGDRNLVCACIPIEDYE